MRKFFFALLVAVLVATGSQVAHSASACSTSDIEVRGMHWRVVDERLYTLGDLVNHCGEPIGVQLKVTARDGAGKVIDTHDDWPASDRNIPPNTPYAFKTRNTGDINGPASVTVEVIEVRRWGK
jgi:hypothetical protein